MRNKTYLVTNPCLLPVAFAQRITSQQLTALMQYFNLPCTSSRFAYAPYSRKLQQQLKANPEYCKRSLRIWKDIEGRVARYIANDLAKAA